MTFLENKKIFFAICDEYAPKNNEYFTDDEDIQEKVALLYSSPYEELAGIRTTPKLKEISVAKSENVGYEKQKLPKARQIKSITCLDSYNNIINCDYRIQGDFIYLSNRDNYTYNIEYIPFLTPISEATTDDFELELDQDLQELLPFMVANDLFITDPGQDWKAFNAVFQRKMQLIRANKVGMSVNISEGEID